MDVWQITGIVCACWIGVAITGCIVWESLVKEIRQQHPNDETVATLRDEHAGLRQAYEELDEEHQFLRTTNKMITDRYADAVSKGLI